jgi:hypothetical protein
MATKAERFRYRAERSGPKKVKQPERPRRDVPVDTAEPGRDRTIAAARKGGAVLEDSSGPPSRKSSRRSHGKVETKSFNAAGVESKRQGEGKTKRSANLQLRTVARVRSPSSRTRRKIGGSAGKP